MTTLASLLKVLQTNRVELRRYIADSDEWIRMNASSLPAADQSELRKIADDIGVLLEIRSRGQLRQTSETRFMAGKDIGRRNLMVKAASAILAVPFAALLAGSASSAPLGFAGDSSCDNGCNNAGACSDSGCTDYQCENDQVCRDTNGCHDIDCSNGICDDTGCQDADCQNLTCQDGSDAGGCIDSPCANALNCTDNVLCSDSTCTNSSGCDDTSLCTDNECVDQPFCPYDPC